MRVLECVFAEGSEEHRTLIFEEIKGKVYFLDDKFLVLKLVCFVVGSFSELFLK